MIYKALPNVVSAGNSYEEEPQTAASLEFRQLIGGMKSRWRLAAASSAAAFLAGYLLLTAIPLRYESSVQLVVFDPQQPDVTALGASGPPVRELDTVALNTQMELIKSTSLATRVIKDLKLDQDPEFQPHHTLAALRAQIYGLYSQRLLEPLARLTGWPGLDAFPRDTPDTAASTNQDQETRVAQAARIMRDHISVARVPLSYVVVVTAKSTNPRTAQALAKSLVDDYLASQREQEQKALGQMALWLSSELGILKDRITQTDTKMESLRSASGLTDSGKGSLISQQINELNTQLMAIRADVAEKHAELEQSVKDGGVGALSNTPGATSLNQLRTQRSMLSLQLATLREKLGDRHTQVVAQDAQLAGIDKAIKDEAARLVSDMRTSYDIAVRRQQAIEANLQLLSADQAADGASVQLQELKRVSEADNKLYDSYLSRYNEIESNKSLDALGNRIISPAGLPLQPTFGPQWLFLAGAAMLATLIGILVAAVLSFLKRGMNTGPDAERMFGCPVIGRIPLNRTRRTNARLVDLPFIQTVMGKSWTPIQETIRNIRIGLKLTNLGSPGPKVILVTSAFAGEGKSTTAALLAASSAAAHQRTLLIDCDIHGRAISQDFAVPHPGLTDLLSGKADLNAITVRNPVVGFDIIPIGLSGADASDLLASANMAQALVRLREAYDYVVIDCPPVLSAVEPLILANLADKLLLVVDCRQMQCNRVTDALRLLRSHSDRVAGIVFNNVASHTSKPPAKRQPVAAATSVRDFMSTPKTASA